MGWVKCFERDLETGEWCQGAAKKTSSKSSVLDLEWLETIRKPFFVLSMSSTCCQRIVGAGRLTGVDRRTSAPLLLSIASKMRWLPPAMDLASNDASDTAVPRAWILSMSVAYCCQPNSPLCSAKAQQATHIRARVRLHDLVDPQLAGLDNVARPVLSRARGQFATQVNALSKLLDVHHRPTVRKPLRIVQPRKLLQEAIDSEVVAYGRQRTVALQRGVRVPPVRPALVLARRPEDELGAVPDGDAVLHEFGAFQVETQELWSARSAQVWEMGLGTDDCAGSHGQGRRLTLAALTRLRLASMKMLAPSSNGLRFLSPWGYTVVLPAVLVPALLSSPCTAREPSPPMADLSLRGMNTHVHQYNPRPHTQ